MVDSLSNRPNVQVGDEFWRVVTIQVMPYEYSEQLVTQLQAELWSTVFKHGQCG